MKIRNWSKFQHFKDRKPPWVKLYRDVLDDMEWYELDPLASKVLVMCWLIASEDDGCLPNSKTLAFRLRMTEKQTIDCLNKLSHWLEQDDINAISEQYQTDSLETERETETKKETKGATAIVLPDWMPLETWQAFLAMRKKMKRVPTDHAVDLLIKKLDRFRANGQNIQAVLEKSITSNWQDVFEINERQPFANKYDVAGITTPPPPNQDAALRKIEEDRKKAVPPSLETLAKLAELRKGVQA
jgi:hypothetical protein